MRTILTVVRSADPGELVLAGCCLTLALACSAGSWRAMLGRRIRFPDACARYGTGSLANTFLPARGGDAIRLALFGRVVPGGALEVAGAVTAVGVARWLALLPLGVAGALDDGLPAPAVALAGAAAAPLLVAWLCARGGSRRARALLAPLRAADRRTFLALAAWVAATLLARLAAASLAGDALGVRHPLAAALLVVPALELVGIVPLTPGNIGVAGGAASFAFRANGMPTQEAVAAGFALHGFETAVGILVGCVCATALALARASPVCNRSVPEPLPMDEQARRSILRAVRKPQHKGGTMRKWTRRLALVVAAAAAAGLAATAHAAVRGGGDGDGGGFRSATRTPIQHVVVIFQENVSFDHYFATYPNAANTDGQPFVAAPHTPAVDGLTPATASSIPPSLRHSADLTATNPNSSLPIRLASSPDGPGGNGNGQLTCDQDHNYSDEQQSFDGGLMDQFVQSVGTDGGSHIPAFAGNPLAPLCNPNTVMDYYDGNSTTALWNYAQRYSMSDNSYDTEFGPSAPGAIDLASGNTGGVDTAHMVNAPTVATSAAPNADITADGLGGYSLTSDAQPYWDDCSTRDAVALKGTNIGDELNTAGLSWGWFEGGFRPSESFTAGLAAVGASGQPTSTFIPDQFKNAGFAALVPHSSNQGLCDTVHPVGTAFGATIASAPWGYKDDYIPHHEPFEYYASTANPHHLSIPTDASGNDTVAGLQTVGNDTQSYVGGVPQFNTPNHNYDTSDFDQLVAAIAAHKLPASALPAVTFLKAPGYEDGHAAYSDPADEQAWLVKEINALQQTPDWSSTAVFVNYDDSDGWYDHVYSGVVNPSASVADNLTHTTLGKISATNPTSGLCGTVSATSVPLANEQARCGFSSRLPMLLISPWAKFNDVDHNLSDQASIINFVEYNWRLPAIPGSFDQALAQQDKAEHIKFDLAGMFDFRRDENHFALRDFPFDPVTGQVNLAGANLSHRDLEQVNLSGANLTGADLDGSHLDDAFLPNANLTGASLRRADLRRADLTGVTWSNTTCPDGTNSNNHGNTCVGHL
jgi:phospholipase C